MPLTRRRGSEVYISYLIHSGLIGIGFLEADSAVRRGSFNTLKNYTFVAKTKTHKTLLLLAPSIVTNFSTRRVTNTVQNATKLIEVHKIMFRRVIAKQQKVLEKRI